jgi:hypothetical protein
LIVGTDLATLKFAEVVTGMAKFDPLFGLDDGFREPMGLGCGHPQQMEGNALCRLGTNAGQATKLVDEVLYWGAVHP